MSPTGRQEKHPSPTPEHPHGCCHAEKMLTIRKIQPAVSSSSFCQRSMGGKKRKGIEYFNKRDGEIKINPSGPDSSTTSTPFCPPQTAQVPFSDACFLLSVALRSPHTKLTHFREVLSRADPSGHQPTQDHASVTNRPSGSFWLF